MDVDVDKLLDNVNDLESYVKSLRENSEALASRKLNTQNE